MVEEQIKNAFLCKLRLGTISPFEVGYQLQQKGVPSFQIEKLKNEILNAYKKNNPCY